MSAQSRGWSREGTASPGAVGGTEGHRPTRLPARRPLRQRSPKHPPQPLRRGRTLPTPNPGGCDSMKTPRTNTLQPCRGREEGTPFLEGGLHPLH